MIIRQGEFWINTIKPEIQQDICNNRNLENNDNNIEIPESLTVSNVVEETQPDNIEICVELRWEVAQALLGQTNLADFHYQK